MYALHPEFQKVERPPTLWHDAAHAERPGTQFSEAPATSRHCQKPCFETSCEAQSTADAIHCCSAQQ